MALMHISFVCLSAFLFAAPASAERTSRAQPGTAPCPDRAWRVLVIGGELQPNSWCDKSTSVVEGKGKSNNGKHLGWRNHQERMRADREAYERKKESERKAVEEKKKAEEEKRKAAEEKRKAEEEKRKAAEAKRKADEAKRKASHDEDTKVRKDKGR